MLFRSGRKFIFLFSFVVVSMSLKSEKTNKVNNTNELQSQPRKSVVVDFPRKSDLVPYIRSLERILNFCARNKNDIDINFDFGLFLLSVNLKSTMKQRGQQLPLNLRTKLNDIVKKSDKLLKFFGYMVRQNKEPRNQKNKLIYTLFSNETLWTDRMKKFNSIMWKQSPLTPKQLEEKYSKWNTYIKNVDNINEWMPKPYESDMCMVSVANNAIRRFNSLPKCKVAESCYEILLKGSDFGYALSHRLLLLLLARFGRGCVVFTPALDRELTRRFCEAAYGEADYIAMNGFQIADLLLEQISLCTLDGHTHFLRRSWMTGLLKYQTPPGCFGRKPKRVKRVAAAVAKVKGPWKMTRPRDYEILDGLCNGHFTAVGASALSAYIKFILFSFY